MTERDQISRYRRSRSIDAPADMVFDYISRLENLPSYLPPINSAEATGGETIRLRGEIPGQGEIEGEGYFRVQEAERRVAWGSRFGRDYDGEMWVSESGNGSEVTVELAFGPRSVEDKIEQQAGAGEDPIEAGIDDTLESIRRQIEEGSGKVPPSDPQREGASA